MQVVSGQTVTPVAADANPLTSESKNFSHRPAASLLRILIATLFGLLVLVAWVGLPFEIPYIGYGLGSAFIFQVAVRPRRREIFWVTVGACGLVLFDTLIVHQGSLENLRLSICFGMLGLVSFLVLGLKAVWAEGVEQAQLKSILVPAAALTFFILGSQKLLNLSGLLFPKTLDLYAYAFDGSLGFQPSFLLGRLFRDFPVVSLIGHFTYFALPIAMALVYAGHLRRKNTPPLFILEILMAAGLLGYFLYLAFPVAGPAYVAGPSFPGSPLTLSALHQLNLQPIPLNWKISRNAMPSLHMTWMLLLWFNCKSFSRWVRALAFGLVLITICDTLGTGEHYLIDLVVACPFAVAIQALCTRWVPLQSKARLVPLVGGAAVLVTWLFLLGYGTNWFLLTPVIPWACVIASTTMSALWMREIMSVNCIKPMSRGRVRVDHCGEVEVGQ
jgi:hypothetical protein